MDKTKHRPFLDGKFKGFWDSVRHSPYPWHYTIRWPLYFYRPSARNRSGLPAQPASFVHPDLTDSPESQTLKLLFAGDIMVLNGDRPPQLCAELCSLMETSDFFVASLEAPVGPHAPRPDVRYTFQFHMPFSFLEAIQRQARLPFARWVLTNANNHSGDVGAAGFEQSIAALESASIQHVGWNGDDAYRIVCAKGMKVGFAAWTHWLNRHLDNGDRTLVTDRNLPDLISFDAKTRAGVDFLVGLPHWEYEFQHFPHRSTRRLAGTLLTGGADLIVGSHPHVLQPYEKIGDGYCFYSLGNFCGLGIAWPAKIISLLELHLARDRKDRAIKVSRFQFHHYYQIHVDDQVRIVPMHEVPPHQRRRAVARVAKILKRNDRSGNA